MKTIQLSVRCTREEYMQFCAACRKGPKWTMAAGAVSVAVAVLFCMVDQMIHSHTLLLGLIGVTLMMWSPLILPTVRKGAAGRRYDASDALKGALTVEIGEETLKIRSACQEGTVPLSALTAVERTEHVIALVFGKELTVCIPIRSMDEDEWYDIHAVLSQYRKG